MHERYRARLKGPLEVSLGPRPEIPPRTSGKVGVQLGPRGGEGSQGSADQLSAVSPWDRVRGCAGWLAGLMTPPISKRKGAGDTQTIAFQTYLIAPANGRRNLPGRPTGTSGARSRPSWPACAEPHHNGEIALPLHARTHAPAYTHAHTHTHILTALVRLPLPSHEPFAGSAA